MSDVMDMEHDTEDRVKEKTFAVRDELVSQAYDRCMAQARTVVRADYTFRNARRDLAKQCANLLWAVFSYEDIDASLRMHVGFPPELVQVLVDRDLEPPPYQSFNPFLGVWNHFYFKARAAATWGANQHPFTQEEADSEIGTDRLIVPPLSSHATASEAAAHATAERMARQIAAGDLDQSDNAKWAMASKYGRWIMAAIDMEDASVFDLTYLAMDARYKAWLKREPFLDFRTEPLPPDTRKPSVARQPERTVRGAKGTRTAAQTSTATQAAASAAGSTEEEASATSQVDQVMERLAAARAAAAAGKPIEQPITPTVDAATATQPEPVVVQPEPVAIQPEPVVVQPEPVAIQPEPAATQPEPVAIQPEPVVVQPEPVAIQPEPVAIQPEPVVVQPAQPEPVVESRAIQRMLVDTVTLVLDEDVMDQLPEEGVLTYRKTADGKIMIFGWLEHRQITRPE